MPLKATPEVWIAGASTLISICALWVAVQSNNNTQQQNRLSLRPFVEVAVRGDDTGVGLVIENKGIGPAIINNIRFWRESKEITLEQVIDQSGIHGIPKSLQKGIYIGRLFHIVVPASNTTRVVWFPEAGVNADGVHSAMYEGLYAGLSASGISWDYCYCSAYDECWYGDLKHADQRPVRGCRDYESSVQKYRDQFH